MMMHSLDNYDDLYNLDLLTDTREELIENKLRDNCIKKYRVKTIRSGKILECEIYPIWKGRKSARIKKSKVSRLAQKNLNDKNRRKYVIRLINANFDETGTWLTLTYDDAHLPSSPEDAKKEMTNYIKRLKRYIKKYNLPELKYIYITENREDGEEKRIHHHMITNFSDRDVLESKWNGGGRTNASRLQPDDFELEGLARYITKDPRGSKSYTPSRNLKKPIITIADSKMTKRRADKIAEGKADAETIFEKLYQGYQYQKIDIKFSDMISGAFIYVRMRRDEYKHKRE